MVVAEERHRADLREARLDVRDGLERRPRAQDGDGVAVAGVLRVECEVAVRRVEELCCGHICVHREVRGRIDTRRGYARGETGDGVLGDSVSELVDSVNVCICVTVSSQFGGLSNPIESNPYHLRRDTAGPSRVRCQRSP